MENPKGSNFFDTGTPAWIMSKVGRALIGGNWKCNGTVASVQSMISTLNAAGPFSSNSEVVIAGPALHLSQMKANFRSEIATAAEDVSFAKGYGAFTGEMTADMLVDSGIKWTLTGHSERRVGFGQTGEPSNVVGVKTKNAVNKGMSVIACIGELLDDREGGRTMDVCAAQLAAIQATLSLEDWKQVVIAYEPVWAIGTGKVATPEQAQDTHAEIRSWLSAVVSPAVADETRIIYGGSASSANCDALYAMPDINGFLVGGASLKEEFVKIINCTK
jgi:triosephosphate isomerase (TIM)